MNRGVTRLSKIIFRKPYCNISARIATSVQNDTQHPCNCRAVSCPKFAFAGIVPCHNSCPWPAGFSNPSPTLSPIVAFPSGTACCREWPCSFSQCPRSCNVTARPVATWMIHRYPATCAPSSVSRKPLRIPASGNVSTGLTPSICGPSSAG